MSAVERVALLMTGECHPRHVPGGVVWFVGEEPATEEQAALLGELVPADFEAAVSLLRADLEIERCRRTESLREFAATAERFLATHQGWGTR